MSVSFEEFTGTDFPLELAANAWDGTEAGHGGIGTSGVGWALGGEITGGKRYMRPEQADPRDYRHPQVGWGLILPDDPHIAVEARGRADDAPEPIRALVAARPHAKVLRWEPSMGPMALADYANGGHIPISGAPAGTAAGALPRYLLLYGGPDTLPWNLQFALNVGNFVGRLHLTGQALENYVSALLNDWGDSTVRYDQPVVWAPDFGGDDMTALMRSSIASPVAEKLKADREITRVSFLSGTPGADEPATAAALSKTLAANVPALVVTTSHGMTGPAGDPEALRRNLGLLVDQSRDLVYPEDLLTTWNPDGAIWYAHACCSAGSNSPSSYAELFDTGSHLAGLLRTVAGVGPTVAPLPTALLGAGHPLRAFIGHVEPTFDWTLRFPWTRQYLTSSIHTTLYNGLCAGEPVGYALRSVWAQVGELAAALPEALKLFNRSRETRTQGLSAALYCQLASRDRGDTVVLGDPTVSLRLPLPS